MKNNQPTLADRLDAVLARILPPGASRQSAYVFDVTGDGREIVRVTTNPDTGERVVGVGATKADAVADLERRFPA